MEATPPSGSLLRLRETDDRVNWSREEIEAAGDGDAQPRDLPARKPASVMRTLTVAEEHRLMSPRHRSGRHTSSCRSRRRAPSALPVMLTPPVGHRSTRTLAPRHLGRPLCPRTGRGDGASTSLLRTLGLDRPIHFLYARRLSVSTDFPKLSGVGESRVSEGQ